MSDIAMAQSVLWEDYYKVAWVNIVTGEYKFVKILETAEEKPCLEGNTIYDYCRLVVSTGLVPQNDIPQYQHITDKSYIMQEVLKKRKRVTVDFRRIIGSGTKWVRLEIVLPKDFSEDDPWAVYTWKESDSQTSTVEDAIRILSQCFHKILKVDLNRDSFEIIKAYPEELTNQAGFSTIFSTWVRNTINTGKICNEDLPALLDFLNTERLRNRFRESRDCLRLRYRRNFTGDLRWVYMELLPSIEYTPEDQIIMMYIRDIHDDYVSELQRQKALEYYCNFDTLTGLHSRFCYNNFCRSFDERGGALAVLFADVNGLKFTNDTKGHEYGDRLITSFAEALSTEFGVENCFRISGDEFVVLIAGTEEAAFLEKTRLFREHLGSFEIPPASVGTAWGSNAGSVDELVRLAESRMYDDKREFYKLHPEMKR